MAEDLVEDVEWADDTHDVHWSALRLINHHAAPPNPYSFVRSSIGLTLYLRQAGVDHFCGSELTRAARADKIGAIAKTLPTDPVTGEVLLLPARSAWPAAACILLVAERMRKICGPMSPVYWWRPSAYNEAVSSANVKPQSDHIMACAIDLQCNDSSGLDSAVEAVIDPLWLSERHTMLYGLSVGHRRGSHKIHLGCWAPSTRAKGRPRRWSYDPRNGAETPYR